MSQQDKDDATEQHSSGSRIHRRNFVKALGSSGVAVGLAGCSGGGGGGGDGGSDGDGGDGGSTDTDTDTPSSDGTTTEGSSDSGGDEVTLQFFTWPGYVNNQERMNTLLHEEGLPENITVEMLSVFSQTDGAQSKYRQWLSSGREKPDLMAFDSGWIQPFILRDQILNIEQDLLPSDVVSTVRDEYFDTALRAGTGPEGSLWALPHFPDFPHIQYRKDLVREAGYDPSGWATSAMSWERFANIAKDVSEQTDTKHGYLFQAPAAEQLSCCVFNEFLSGWGGAYFGNPEENLFGPIGDRPVTVDEQPVIDSLRMGRSFIHGPDDEYAMDGFPQITPESVFQWGVVGSNKPFANGDAVFSRNWPFLLPSLAEKYGDDFGTMPIPYGVEEGQGKYPGTGGSINAQGIWYIAVNPNSQNVDACGEFLKAMTSERIMLETFKLAGWLPPKPSVLDSEEARNVAGVGDHIDTILYLADHALPRPATAAWPTQTTKVSQRAQEALKSKDPAQAMGTLKEELTQIENSF